MPPLGNEFDLLETILWDEELRLQAFHFDRLQNSASSLHRPFDCTSAEELLRAETGKFSPGQRFVVQLNLGPTGQLQLRSTPWQPATGIGRVRLAEERVNSGDPLLQHRTTQREVYDRLYSLARRDGLDDVLFLNERDEVTEGAVHSLFIEKGGRLATSPVACGLLPGVYRRFLLETRPGAEERVLTLNDLRDADTVYLSDSVHGLRPTVVEGLQGAQAQAPQRM